MAVSKAEQRRSSSFNANWAGSPIIRNKSLLRTLKKQEECDLLSELSSSLRHFRKGGREAIKKDLLELIRDEESIDDIERVVSNLGISFVIVAFDLTLMRRVL